MSKEILRATGWGDFQANKEILRTMGAAPSATTCCCATGTCS